MNSTPRTKNLLPIIAGGLLIGYVLLLLGLTLFEQNTRMESDAEQVRLGLEKRAAALSYFYSVRRDDLSTLGEHHAVTSFFANRDLGMSLQYGLGTSLLNMRRAFEQLAEQRRITDEPVYLRILLRELDGNTLLDTLSHQEPDLTEDLPLDPDAIRILPWGTPPANQVLVVAPLRYKGQVMGHILAWINQDLAQHQLISADANADAAGGHILLHVTGTPLPAKLASLIKSTKPRESERFGVRRLPSGGITGRIPVADTPFELIGSFPPHGISGMLSARWFTVSLLILASLILLGVWLTVRMRTHNLVLRARIEESTRQEKILNHKNQELEFEVMHRKDHERELLQARNDAEIASRAKSEFLATMSHEVRTPMNGVLGMTELLLGTGLTDKQREYVETARHSGQTLLDVINNILDFSQIEANKLKLARSPFDLQEVIEDALQMVAEQARKKHLELLSDIPSGISRHVIGDGPRLRQVLINLVGNAVKFTEQGEIILHASSVEVDSDEILILFKVHDTGIGIDTDKLEGIFEAFSQVDASTTRRYGGTGLGLAISRRLISLMGGEISAESKKGEGSTFHFTLRFAKQNQVRKPVTASPDQLVGSKILIVDDNMPIRNLLLKKIKDWGMQVSDANCGDEALMLLQDAATDSKPYALAILDRMMPGMDGITLARKIKADPKTAGTRLLMYSAMHEEAGNSVLREAGIEAYLSKPARLSELHDQLLSLLAEDPSKLDEAIGTSQHGERILLVEDNQVNQLVALEMLELLGCQTEMAENGRVAVENMRANGYDLILMDCHMPVMDGFAATKAIRNQEPEGHHVPIIALTADVQKGVREQCHAVGMDDYLCKPFSQDALQAMLGKWLSVKDKMTDLESQYSTDSTEATQSISHG